MNTRLRQNIIYFGIGIIFWIAIAWYLGEHPGERASLMPSFRMLYQKWQSLLYTISGKNPEVITVKASLEKNFDELLYLVESNTSCMQTTLADDIINYKKSLHDLSYEEILNQQHTYYEYALSLKEKIEKDCE